MLSKYKLEEFNFKKDSAYVYILYRKFEIVYIGVTQRLNERLFTHLRDKRFDTAKYIKTTKELAPGIERELILYYKPLYNTIHKYERRKNPTKKYKDSPQKVMLIIEKESVTLDEIIINLSSRDYKLAELLNVSNRFNVQLKEISDKIKIQKRINESKTT